VGDPSHGVKTVGRWRCIAPILAALTVATCAIAGAPASKTVSLSGKVTGSSGKRTIYVALWTEQNFLQKPTQQIRLDPPNDPVFQFQIPTGRWALSAYEDENGNGVLDMGLMGPKEPSGFWRPFHRWRKPNFDDVAVSVVHDTSDTVIDLRR